MSNKKIDDGGPAFPVPIQKRNFDTSPKDFQETGMSGMSIRDYAIIHFMAALMQREDFDIETGKLMSVESAISPRLLATEQADAMIAARKEKV